MYGNNQYMLDSLNRQKERIDDMIRSYQQPQPVNNFINTGQTNTKDLIELRVLNETEEVDNLYVSTKTLFINDDTMILKGVDGSLQKWSIRKTYPIDKKDEKINALEEEIKKLKEVINEYPKSNEPVRECEQSVSDANGDVDRKSKTNSKSVSK